MTQYLVNTDKDSEEALEKLKQILGIEDTAAVLSMCLGFVYELANLSLSDPAVRDFMDQIANRLKEQYKNGYN
jgi:hypothetical protein